jgi:hypothetical protein
MGGWLWRMHQDSRKTAASHRHRRITWMRVIELEFLTDDENARGLARQ